MAAVAGLLLLCGQFYIFPAVVLNIRWLPTVHRRLASTWTGVALPPPYRPEPARPAPGPDGFYRSRRGRKLYSNDRLPALAEPLPLGLDRPGHRARPALAGARPDHRHRVGGPAGRVDRRRSVRRGHPAGSAGPRSRSGWCSRCSAGWPQPRHWRCTPAGPRCCWPAAPAPHRSADQRWVGDLISDLLNALRMLGPEPRRRRAVHRGGARARVDRSAARHAGRAARPGAARRRRAAWSASGAASASTRPTGPRRLPVAEPPTVAIRRCGPGGGRAGMWLVDRSGDLARPGLARRPAGRRAAPGAAADRAVRLRLVGPRPAGPGIHDGARRPRRALVRLAGRVEPARAGRRAGRDRGRRDAAAQDAALARALGRAAARADRPDPVADRTGSAQRARRHAHREPDGGDGHAGQRGAPDRARPARRRAGPAGRDGHDARRGRGADRPRPRRGQEAARRRPGTRPARPCANCATWCAASTRRCSPNAACRTRSARSPWTTRSTSRSRPTCPAAPTHRSSRRPTSRWPRRWPTRPSTRTPTGSGSTCGTRRAGCGSACSTTAAAARTPRAAAGCAASSAGWLVSTGCAPLSSPLGGPTMVAMELPCVLSSPRTSTSSGTD